MINAFLMNVLMVNPMAETMGNSQNKIEKEAAYLKNARMNADQARAEMRCGIEAQDMAEKTGNRDFIRIAHWHFERCTGKCVKAEKYFLAAQKSLDSRRRREYCRLRVIEMNQLGARAHFLENMLFAENHLTIG